MSVEDAPEQIVPGEEVAVTTGTGFTVIVSEAVFEHPLLLVPVTL